MGTIRRSELDGAVRGGILSAAQADRLEDAKLIGREDTPHDRRGYDCVITRAGLAMRKKMWPLYKAEIESLFSQHITVQEARTIGDALARAVKAAGGEG